MKIYTIGYGNSPFADFLGNLRLHGIELVLDARSAPYSKHSPHYSHKNIRRLLESAGVSYEFMGDCIGGLPQKPEYLNSRGEPDYEKMSADEWFIEGTERILALAAKSAVCIMCAEEDPARCHRSPLIAQRLTARPGVEVLHIRKDGTLENESETARRRFSPKRNQMDLFP